MFHTILVSIIAFAADRIITTMIGSAVGPMGGPGPAWKGGSLSSPPGTRSPRAPRARTWGAACPHSLRPGPRGRVPPGGSAVERPARSGGPDPS